MTGKEFKEFINKEIEDDDIMGSIIISGHWTEANIEDLRIYKEKINDKTEVNISI